jgi:hypothetical protein
MAQKPKQNKACYKVGYTLEKILLKQKKYVYLGTCRS